MDDGWRLQLGSRWPGRSHVAGGGSLGDDDGVDAYEGDLENKRNYT